MNKVLLTVIVAVLLLVCAPSSDAQYRDADGFLIASWFAPATGNPIRNYLISYTINGVVDSVVVETINLEDSTAVLAYLGDWCVANIRAVTIFGDSSLVVPSDTAYFALPSGITDPPIWNTWKE